MRIHAWAWSFVVAGTLIAPTALGQSASAPAFELLRETPLPGAGGWDYLTFDQARRRLFVTRGDHVQVVDADGKVLGDIPDTPGVHGVALANDLGKGYISNGRGASITVFDIDSLRVLDVVKTPDGRNPDFILYAPTARRVIAFNGGSRNATVIDAVTDQVVATIPLSGKPEAAVVDPDGHVLVNIEDRNEVAILDLTAGVRTAVFPLPGCEEPTGLAIDPGNLRLFVGCHNQTMLIIDLRDRTTIAKLPIGKGVDAVTFDARSQLIFSSQGDGTLTVIGKDAVGKYGVLQTVATRPGARTMTWDPDSRRIHLVTADFEVSAANESQPARRVMKPGSFRLLTVGER